ncbi:MAG: hydrogenase expression/formation protein HypE [Candidatus Hydrogenedentes bacterium]|nr:hydrogenase expression/formation protein HypE [Candidatus Hydrogenedentota bacterium]
MNGKPAPAIACPLPLPDQGHITLAHGGGGTRMHDLLERVFLKRFRNELGDGQTDAATIAVGEGRLAFTTDSFVVDPPFFPGGDIGSLAVHGTVNDLAMAGAEPRYLSAAFILEEGFELARLEQVADSMQAAALAAGVQIVTGDTKVIERQRGGGIYINTAGIGVVRPGVALGPGAIQSGDRVIINGDLGRHGMAIMTMRAGFDVDTPIESDSAALWPEVKALLDAGIAVHCLRDLTRGGLASALNELSASSGRAIHIAEDRVPVLPAVRGVCEILGFDPLHVANEGRFAAIVAPEDAARAVAILSALHPDAPAADIGAVTDAAERRVTLESVIGVTRVLDMLSGEQLPRIC